MDKHELIEITVKEITEEAVNFKNAENPSEELEALKDMLDVLMRSTTVTQMAEPAFQTVKQLATLIPQT